MSFLKGPFKNLVSKSSVEKRGKFQVSEGLRKITGFKGLYLGLSIGWTTQFVVFDVAPFAKWTLISLGCQVVASMHN